MAVVGLQPAFEPQDWRLALATLEDAYARETIRSAVRQFGAFERWCLAEGLSYLPATPEIVAAHVEAVHHRYRQSSMAARLGAIRKMHGIYRFPNPIRGRAVYLAIRRGRRAYGGEPNQALGLRRDGLAQLLAACPDTLVGRRDRLMFRIAYDTLGRAGEVIHYCVEDVSYLPDGSARLRVKSSKTDAFGRGGSAFVSATTALELRAWLKASGITSGPILRRVRGNHVAGHRMHASILGRQLREVAEAAAMSPAVVRALTGHSLRVGAAQDLAADGRSLLEIMCAGRWKNVEVLARYARKATVNVWAPRSS